jgi:hypothetical protein
VKIIITERQAQKLFGETINCKCGHKWKKEKNDKDPYLCHMCGWNQKFKNYDDTKLIEFWKNYKK